MKRSLFVWAFVIGIALMAQSTRRASANTFDHEYRSFAGLLKSYVRFPRVDYAALTADRTSLDRAVTELDAPAAGEESAWAPEQRMAFWINAYNAFTLRAIVDNYPIRGGWLTRSPRNSIRQIDGVWTNLKWRAAGRTVTLDDIEHRILRPTFKDARIHFAVNCASISCPPLATEPYRARTLEAQLDAAARLFLASPEGVRVDGNTLRVSSLFKWYGEDFTEHYPAIVPGSRAERERAILGVIAKYGSAAAAELARSGRPAIRYLAYDWSLNDTQR